MKYGEWRKEPDDLENRPTGLWSRLYEQLWICVGKRPWTYIMRDAWHRWQLVWIFSLVGLGVVLGHVFW